MVHQDALARWGALPEVRVGQHPPEEEIHRKAAFIQGFSGVNEEEKGRKENMLLLLLIDAKELLPASKRKLQGFRKN